MVHHIRPLPFGDEIARLVLGRQDCTDCTGCQDFGGVAAEMRLPMPATKSLLPSSWDNTIDMVTKELIQNEIEFFSEPYREEILDWSCPCFTEIFLYYLSL